MKLSLKCAEATRLISEGLDRDLSIAERTALRVHLALCVACTRANKQLAFLRRALRQYPGPDDDAR